MAVRKRKAPRKPKVHAVASTYIDPVDCDSTVSYKVVTGRYGRLHGSVQLADCNRKIDWFFSGDADALDKADRAIHALQAFRGALATAIEQKPKRVRRVQA